MPTPYTGDRTQTRAPGARPAAGISPILNLPIDGDNDNAATFAQSYEELADYVHWAMAPTPIAGNWADPAWYVQNALGQKKFTVDHMGFAGGRIVQWQENWRGSESIVATALGSLTATGQIWSAYLNNVGGAGAIATLDPFVSYGRRGLKLTLGQDPTDYCIVFGQPHGAFLSTVGVAIDFDVRTDTGINQMHASAGLVQGGVGDVHTPANTMVGGVFYKTNATANWMCVCSDGTTLGTPIDTGVAVAINTDYRKRVEWLGSGVADDGVSAMRFYINETLVGTFTANIPVASQICTPAFTITRDTGTTVRDILIGPVRFSTSY